MSRHRSHLVHSIGFLTSILIYRWVNVGFTIFSFGDFVGQQLNDLHVSPLARTRQDLTFQIRNDDLHVVISFDASNAS